MTDTSPRPGWWLASDGQWYPPDLHPRSRPVASAESPATEPPAATGYPATEPPATAPTTAAAGIDWEVVARERAAAQAERDRLEAVRRRRSAVLGGAAVIVLGLLLGAVVTSGGDGDGTAATATTVAADATTSTAAARTTATASPTTVLSTDATISVFSLQPGMCIEQEDLTRSLVMNVHTVPCTTPHTHEVYLRTTITPVDAPYDTAKVTEFANKACTEGFTGYVGIPYEQSKYYYLHLAPSAESWNKSRDRDVVCLVLLEGQKLTSSVKGNGQ
jgi:hypothetical protein